MQITHPEFPYFVDLGHVIKAKINIDLPCEMLKFGMSCGDDARNMILNYEQELGTDVAAVTATVVVCDECLESIDRNYIQRQHVLVNPELKSELY